VGPDTTYYPVTVTDYIVKNNLKGPMFNLYVWGGYLIWRLGPETKVFCYGRQLYSERYWEYMSGIMMGDPESPYWKKLFTKYNIQTVILPFVTDTGIPFPLTQSLYEDKEWIMVFVSENAALFRKRDIRA